MGIIMALNGLVQSLPDCISLAQILPAAQCKQLAAMHGQCHHSHTAQPCKRMQPFHL